MALLVKELSIEAVAALRPLVPRIRRHDRSLADRLVRAASSVALNIAEGEHSDPGNRKARSTRLRGARTRRSRRSGLRWLGGTSPSRRRKWRRGCCGG